MKESIDDASPDITDEELWEEKELWEISEVDLWELFTGLPKRPDYFKNGLTGQITLVTQREVKAIRSAVASAPAATLRYGDYILLLMWIREARFALPPLHKGSLLAFFKRMFLVKQP